MSEVLLHNVIYVTLAEPRLGESHFIEVGADVGDSIQTNVDEEALERGATLIKLESARYRRKPDKVKIKSSMATKHLVEHLLPQFVG